MGSKHDTTNRRRQHYAYQMPPRTNGGKGKYDHLKQMAPDQPQTHMDVHRKPIPGVSASTTGMHHPSQPGVWAQDSMSSPSASSQQHLAQASTASSAADQCDRGERWPTWAHVETGIQDVQHCHE